jgi:hypothetical protein
MKPLFRRPSKRGFATGVVIATLSTRHYQHYQYNMQSVGFGASLNRDLVTPPLSAYNELPRALRMRNTGRNYQAVAQSYSPKPPSSAKLRCTTSATSSCGSMVLCDAEPDQLAPKRISPSSNEQISLRPEVKQILH